MSDNVDSDRFSTGCDEGSAAAREAAKPLNESHPELRSLLWLMKEGIVTRSTFYDRVVALSNATMR